MKIIQITDLHIDSPSDNTYGMDVKKNFTEVLQAAVERKPDLLVLTGDFCHTASDLATYRWVKSLVDKTGIPYEVISGNHDNSKETAIGFERENLLKGEELYFTKEIAGKEVLFLDTSTYVLPDTQIAWLKTKLAEASEPVIIFMHHPPCTGGVRFMDEKYPLENKEEVEAVLRGCPQPVTVFCGHYHASRSIHKGNLTVHITASTYLQIASEPEEYTPDPTGVAYREIILENGYIRTEVRYLPFNFI